MHNTNWGRIWSINTVAVLLSYRTFVLYLYTCITELQHCQWINCIMYRFCTAMSGHSLMSHTHMKPSWTILTCTKLNYLQYSSMNLNLILQLIKFVCGVKHQTFLARLETVGGAGGVNPYLLWVPAQRVPFALNLVNVKSKSAVT